MAALSGVRIVVTRAAHQAEELAAPLRHLGADVILLPLLGIAGPRDPTGLQQAVRNRQQYDWIVFTSSNAVAAFAAEMHDTANTVQPARIAVVGSATREAAEENGFRVSLMPARYVAESLLDSFAGLELAGARILIPRAEVARDLVPEELRKRGALVDVVNAYRNVVPPEASAQVPIVFRSPLPDWVLFASSSAVDHLAELWRPDVAATIRMASIGPVTSTTIRKYGWTVSAEADPHTIPGLIHAVLAAHVDLD